MGETGAASIPTGDEKQPAPASCNGARDNNNNNNSKKREGLFANPVREFRGCQLIQRNFDNMPFLEQFEFFPDDIIVATFPKSGTTWMQAIVTMVLNKGNPACLADGYLEAKWPYLDHSGRKPGKAGPGDPPLHAAKTLSRPRTLKTHLPWNVLPATVAKAGSKVIYVARNPKDTMVSMYYFVKSHTNLAYRGDFDEFVKHFMKDEIVYCPYFANVASYWSRRDESNVFFTTYERLHKDPIGEVEKVAAFLGVGAGLTKEVASQIVHYTTFDAMANNDKTNYSQAGQLGIIDFTISPFFRSGKIGTWKQHLTVAQNELVDEWIAASVRKYHLEELTFEYV